MRRLRRPVLAAAALGLAAAASGCAYFSPVQTQDFYQTADGTNASIVDEQGTFEIGVRNAIVVVDDDGTAALRGSVVSYSTEQATVELTGEVEGSPAFSASVTVAPGEVIELGPDEGQQEVAIEGLTVEPGDVIDLVVTATGKTVEASLPVTDTTLAYYGDPSDAGGSSDMGGTSESNGNQEAEAEQAEEAGH